MDAKCLAACQKCHNDLGAALTDAAGDPAKANWQAILQTVLTVINTVLPAIIPLLPVKGQNPPTP